MLPDGTERLWALRPGPTKYHRSVSAAGTIQKPSRRDPAVTAILRSWRRLTGAGKSGSKPRRTLVACSGGADSSALALALAAATDELVVAHIVHDMRPRSDALADRDAVAHLAGALGLPFVEAEVAVKTQRGNAEAAARRLRYAALADLAARSGCAYLATAHHADDQLETILMGLIRGAGLSGLRGVAPKRKLAEPVGKGPWLIRPMLGVGRTEAERICREAGWTWREDRTNQDRSRTRAAIRHEIVPLLKSLRPRAAEHAAQSAEQIRDAGRMVARRVAELHAMGRMREKSAGENAVRTPSGLAWERKALRGDRPIVLGALLRLVASRGANSRGADRLTWRAVQPVVQAIRDRGTDPRRFEWAGGVMVTVDAHIVRVEWMGQHG
jgi:tRNA(Ile)-lysidine synthetase-like protein